MKKPIQATLRVEMTPAPTGIPVEVFVPLMKAIEKLVESLERDTFGRKVRGSRVGMGGSGMVSGGGVLVVEMTLLDRDWKPIECEVPE